MPRLTDAPLRSSVRTRALTQVLTLAMMAFAVSPWALASDGATPVSIRLSLSEAIDLALEKSPRIMAALSNVTQAELSLAEASASLGLGVAIEATPVYHSTAGRPAAPSASLSLSRMGTVVKAGVAKAAGDEVRWSLSLSRPLTRDAATLKAIEAVGAAQESLELARLELDCARNQLGLEVEEAYYSALKADEQAGIARATLEVLRRHIGKAEEAFRQGNLSEVDLLAARREALAGQLSARRAEEAAAMARRRLCCLLGLPAGSSLELAPVARDPFAVDPDADRGDIRVDDLVMRAREVSCEVRRQSVVVEGAERRLELAKSRPRVDVACLVSVDDGNAWSLGLTISCANVRGLRGAGPGAWGPRAGSAWDVEIARCEGDLRASRLAEAQERDKVEVRVRDLYNDLIGAGDALVLSRLSQREAELRLEAAEDILGRGVATQLDVMEASVKLGEARTQCVHALYDYLLARSRLKNAAGTVYTGGVIGGTRQGA